eukprot:TRINITY_DN4537_c0_g1_i1.p1 TRINITY_DN4537_c0_g1~~TRINITY_DN4537_c0_g1_i1.p1  ORF type:complete len:465 (+),score=52.08 TRINITY_DN4537_c0_g1_i1:493-1887(+)
MLCALLAIAFVSIIHERPTFSKVVSLIDFETVGLLFGMMIMVGILSTTGLFEWLAVKAYKFSKGNVWSLSVILCLVTAIVSALLDNVTTLLLIAPVSLTLCKVLDVPPKTLIIFEALFSNIGGAMTIIGDPPNIIIGNNAYIKEYVNFANFSLHMMPGVVVAMLVTFVYMWKFYRHELSREPHAGTKMDIQIMKNTLHRFNDSHEPETETLREALQRHIEELEDKLLTDPHLDTLPELEEKYVITDYPLMINSMIILSIVMLLFFVHSFIGIEMGLAWIAVIGAILHILVSGNHNLEEILERVEFGTLLFFAALFILMENISELGLIEALANTMIDAISSVPDGNGRLVAATLILIWVSGLASAFMDNIPYTATLVPVLVRLAESDLGLPLAPLVWALVFGACFGGNGTIIGASANVVAVSVCEQFGVPISFLEFFKIGFPVTLISLAVSTVYMLIFHVAIPWY